ncbi:hypothetical protein XCR_0618 [Xanthomonas campestris pv. raphani 756C]|nr:hypothetical protein XCR_0618 [Xanthomonas campestris pv. raphani 756C]
MQPITVAPGQGADPVRAVPRQRCVPAHRVGVMPAAVPAALGQRACLLRVACAGVADSSAGGAGLRMPAQPAL